MNVRQELFNNRDLGYKAFHSRLMPNIDEKYIIGVRIPVLRKLARSLVKENIDFPAEYYEEKMLKGLMAGYRHCSIDEHIRELRQVVPLIDNWAVCDSTCSNLKFTDNNMETMWDFIIEYLNGSEYEVRFLVVMLLDYYIVDDYIDRVLDILTSIKRDEYYINMAVSWALSVAFIKYQDKVMPIIESKCLPDFVHNTAIQKVCDSYRVSPEVKMHIKALKKH